MCPPCACTVTPYAFAWHTALQNTSCNTEHACCAPRAPALWLLAIALDVLRAFLCMLHEAVHACFVSSWSPVLQPALAFCMLSSARMVRSCRSGVAGTAAPLALLVVLGSFTAISHMHGVVLQALHHC